MVPIATLREEWILSFIHLDSQPQIASMREHGMKAVAKPAGGPTVLDIFVERLADFCHLVYMHAVISYMKFDV